MIEKTVLLVEDNPGDVVLLKRALSQCDYIGLLNVVDDGEKAVNYVHRIGEYADAPRPHLILLDLNIPKISGREVLKALKSDDNYATIPIIIMSSSVAEAEIRECLLLHANSFVQKPVGLDEFGSTLSAIAEFWLRVANVPER